MGIYQSTPKSTLITFDVAKPTDEQPCPICNTPVSIITLTKHLVTHLNGKQTQFEDKKQEFDVNDLKL
jgi:hypothetical protein